MDNLIWKQNFMEKTASLSDWNIRIGNDLLDDEGNAIVEGWGNGEAQYYTGEENNLYIDEHGLHLCAQKEQLEQNGKQYSYTSARIDTRNKMSFRYGKLVVRARLPLGQGLWPAIWLMPEQSIYGQWPASGEIDIMEAKGRFPTKVSGTLHYGRSWDNKFTDEYSYNLQNSTIAETHNYSLEWSKDCIRWLVDDFCYAEHKLDNETMPFDQPFYLILNLAVGGWYDRVEVDPAIFPARMTIEGIWLYGE